MSMVADAKTEAVEAEWGKRIARFPVVLVVDEAHNYLTNATTQQDRIIVEKFVAAAKQGRKNRLGLVLITQNPQDVNEAVLSQVSTRLLLGMEEGQAERAGAPKEYQKALPYFERGRMVVHSPENSHPLELRGLEFCLVRH
jgi:DNA helicase HerA-like ATPase